MNIKKIVNLILFIVLISVLSNMSFAQNNQSNNTNGSTGTFYSCTDSDGGLNYFTNGFAQSGGIITEDTCFLRYNAGGGQAVSSCSGQYCALEEAFCSANNPAIYSPNGLGVPCPNGCQYGACINPNETNQTYPEYEKIINGLKIKVLGTTFATTQSERSATLLVNGNKVFLNVGQSTNINGKVITLVNVGSSGAVLIDVSGQTETINGSPNSIPTTEENPEVAPYTKIINGIEIKVLNTQYAVAKSDRRATLLINKNQFDLGVGAVVTVEGKKVTLQNVGSSGAVLVDVNGVIDTINGPASTSSEQTGTDSDSSQGIEVKPVVKDIIILKGYSSDGDLSNLPEPFVSKEGVYNDNTVIVVGSRSDAQDVLGAGDITEKLQFLAKKNNKVTVTILKDTELFDPFSKNTIALSSLDSNNNCVNTIVEKFIRCRDLNLKSGEAIFKFVSQNNKQSLMIVGKASMDVRFATKVFKDFENYRLSGNEVKIIGILSTSNVPYQSEERNRQTDNEQTCNIPVSNALMYAVSLNPDGICMGGELGDLIVPPAFVDNSNHPIPNLQPRGYLDQNRGILSCSIPCSVPVKRTCLKDFGVTYQGANYEENLVDRTRCQSTSTPIGPNGECNNGCKVDNRCLQYGSRFVRNEKPVYCDLDADVRTQKQNRDSCQNNYECLSNSCGNGICQDINERIEGIEQELKEQRSLLQKILDFFSRLFSREE